MKKDKGSLLALICAIGCTVGAAYFGFRIYDYYAEIAKRTSELESIAASVEKRREESDKLQPEVGTDPVVSEDTEAAILPEYEELYRQNSDLIGWIRISDTVIDYPVMQTPMDNDYYLEHNFQKESSSIGVPFVQGDCYVDRDDNLIIHSHHIRGGKMFGALEQYKSRDFYETHRYIEFDILTEHGTYEVLAVFKTVADSADGLWCYDFTHASSEEEYDAFVSRCKAQALYDTGVTAEYGDRLITLSTCEYSHKNGRLLVVAKKIA